MMFNPDIPIATDEQTEDLLGRDSFCARIADGVCIPPAGPGLVLSIEGPWGFGKTSAINLIARHLARLADENQPIIVHFNPWMIGSVEALAQEFFLQVSSAIGLSPHAERAAKLSESLSTYSSLFSVVKWMPGVEPWASLLSNSLKIAGDGAQAVADLTALNIVIGLLSRICG